MVINTNIMAQSTANLLGASSQRLSQSLARLSSGSKINSPADDAAGLAVSMNFNAQIGRADAAGNNIANAVSFSQTQDGYLQQVGNALNRMSELAVQAQDVTKSDSDRKLYNQEFQTLATYINNVGTKDFNGVTIFSGNDLNVTSDSEGGTFAMKGISGDFGVSGATASSTFTPWSLNSKLTDLFGSLPSSDPEYGFGTIGPGNLETWTSVNPGETADHDFPGQSGDTFSSVVNCLDFVLSNYNTTAGGASYDAGTGALSLTLEAGQKLFDSDFKLLAPLGFSPADVDNTNGSSSKTVSVTLGTTTPGTTTGAPDISTADDAKAALTTIKNAISKVAGERATIGSNMERLNSTSQELSTLANNLSAANSRITDVDVAQESTNYAKQNILVQTGTAMLAQANALPQSVLKLLG